MIIKFVAKELPIRKFTRKKDRREYYLAEDAEAQFSEYASVLIVARMKIKSLKKELKNRRKRSRTKK